MMTTNNNIGNNVNNPNSTSSHDTLSEYEAALYDRGIRVWGVDAQNRLRKSHVLFVGLTGQSSEACKNIALSGVGRITIIDNHIVQPQDLSLFLNKDSIGKNRGISSLDGIKDLNPLVNVQVLEKNIDPFDDEFIKQFTLVCIDSLNLTLQCEINQLCRRNGISYFLVHSFGMNSFFFQDHGNNFNYTIKKKIEPKKDDKDQEVKEEIIEKVGKFTSLKDVLLYPWNKFPNRISPLIYLLSILYEFEIKEKSKDINDIKEILNILKEQNKKYNITPIDKNSDIIQLAIKQINSEIAPVCAIVGGIIGQEIVKIISRDQEPLNNIFFYDSLKGFGMVETIKNN